ncbi:hypothetical protein [Bittarella massiliensis (ex Durand et al. 2017)]|uniref:Uncharacterized protein n=1 Tax=Bittarella massiliensis (ex Durand et al. 2017) TaxID=1720313 RepID=A0AAW5KF93_9FIRM|nr:hypothetical protein [Bittarella massiliensis (ex Durand et al. 2017)]MCQ4949183.1 hypothetical protein [Bittarella massiliensis (ex Durand et al. 2017)]
MPQGYTTCFRSAVAFGRVRVLREEGEKRVALERLAAEYSPSSRRAAGGRSSGSSTGSAR